MLNLILFSLAGICCGIFTGLVPGIHINLVSSTLIILSPVILEFVSPLQLASFIVAMSVTHTFLDTIPSIFLGAPDSDTALGVLPGHRLLLRGEGYNAVKLTIIGSLGGLIASSALFPAFFYIIVFTYESIQKYIGQALVLIVAYMILQTERRLISLTLFLASGILGIIVLNGSNLENPLFPLFSGLFGISTLIYSLKSRESIPKQKRTSKLVVTKTTLLRAVFSGQFSGFLTAVLPGLGASSAAVIAMQFNKKLGDYGFLILIGSISTVNFVLSLATFLAIDKARNGSIIAIQQLLESFDAAQCAKLIFCALASGAIAVMIGLFIAKNFARLMERVSYKHLLLFVITFIALLVALLTGWKGILILLVSTSLGLLPPILKCPRSTAMGCLLVPVIFYFLL